MRSGRSRRWRGPALAAAVLAVVAGAAPARASATQGGGAAAEISRLQSEMVAAGGQVHALTLTYTQDELTTAALSAQVAADRVRAEQAGAELASTAASLRQELVLAYIGAYETGGNPVAGGRGGVAFPEGSALADPAVRAGYVAVATGTLSDIVDRYRADRLELSSAESAAAAQADAAGRAGAAALAARNAALAQAGRISDQLDAVEARLVALEEQSLQRSGPPASGSRASTPGVSGSGPAGSGAPGSGAPGSGAPGSGAVQGSTGAGGGTAGSRSGPTPGVQGAPVNGGLVTVVRQQVGLPAAGTSSGGSIPPSPSPARHGPTSTTTTPASTTIPPDSGPAAQPATGAGSGSGAGPGSSSGSASGSGGGGGSGSGPGSNGPGSNGSGSNGSGSNGSGSASSGDGGAGGEWLQLRECESGDDYQANTGNGFYGAYQFSAQTWTDLGYPGRPDLEPPAMQDAAAMKLQAQSGWGQWPACAAALGLT